MSRGASDMDEINMGALRKRFTELDAAGDPAIVEETRVALNNEPECAELMAWHGYALREIGKFDESQQWAERALAAEPNNAMALALSAKESLRVADTRKARVLFEKARAQDPDDYLVLRTGSDMSMFAEFNIEPIEIAQRLCAVFPDLANSYSLLAVVYFTKQMRKESAKVIREMQDRFPDHPCTLYRLMMQAMSERNLVATEKLGDELVARHPQFQDGLAEVASAKLFLGKADEAEKLLQTALAINPNGFRALSLMGDLAERKGSKFEAQKYRKAAKAALPILASLQDQAEVTKLIKQGKAREALEKLEASIDDSPGELSRIGNLHSQLICANILKEWDKLESILNKLEAFGRTDPELYVARAALLRQHQKPAEAIDQLLLGRQEFPDSGALLASLLEHMDDAGRKDEANEIAQKIVNDPGNNAADCIQMFIALDKTGRKVEAETVMAQSLMRFPNDQNLKMMQAVQAMNRGDIGAALSFAKSSGKSFRKISWALRGLLVLAKIVGKLKKK